MSIPNEATAPQIRESPVRTEPASLSRRALNPTRVFVDKDRTAFLWFCVAVVAIIFAATQPYFLIQKFKQRERVVIVDPAGTYYVSPLMDFQEAKDFHAQQSTLAAMAFLERNPKGFDNPELLKQVFLKYACEKAQKQILTETDEMKSKQIHQKPEVAKIDILETREDFVMTHVTGQLIRTGIFEQKAFSESIPGTLVDATIIAAPSSTKNQAGARDPEMHQTKKGNQWSFGMKAHIGVDAESGLVHTVVGTAANVSDISQTHALLHGEEKTVHVDAGYIGVEKRAEIITAHHGVEWRIAAKRGKIKALPESWVKDLTLGYERLKARARALVEHPFHIVKNLFRHRKVRYRGMKKNTAQLHTLFALANLVIAKKHLLSVS